jgi:hypothetical protein
VSIQCIGPPSHEDSCFNRTEDLSSSPVMSFSVVPDEPRDQLTIELIGSDKQLLGALALSSLGFRPLEIFFFSILSDRLTMFHGRVHLIGSASAMIRLMVLV